jgi:hypothetical protein
MHLDRCVILEGNKENNFDMHNADEVTLNLHNGLTIKIKYIDSYINIKIMNNTEKQISISSLQFRVKEAEIGEYKQIMVNPKKSSEKVYALDLKNKIKNPVISNLFTALIGKEQFSNLIMGFIGCRTSNNYFKLIDTKAGKELYVVYDFSNYNCEPGSILELDSIYIGHTNNYVKLLDNYVKLLGNNTNICKVELIGNNRLDNVLFTDKLTAESLRHNGKAVKVSVNRGKKYLIDISSESGKNYIYDIMERYRDENYIIIDLNGINEYIEEVEKHKLFNVYYELNTLFEHIYINYPQVNLSFDNCPVGLTAGRRAILEQKLEISHKKKGLFNRFADKADSHNLNFDFITKLILQKLAAAHKTKFVTNNKKAEELLGVITGSIHSNGINQKELLEVQEDLVGCSSLIPYLSKDKVYGFYVKGKRSSYIAVLNMSSKHSKFYWDLSNDIDEEEIDGAAQEVYTNKSLLISDNAVYVRDVRPGDCLLIKKSV